MLTRRKDIEGPVKVQLPAQGTAVFKAWSGCWWPCWAEIWISAGRMRGPTALSIYARAEPAPSKPTWFLAGLSLCCSVAEASLQLVPSHVLQEHFLAILATLECLRMSSPGHTSPGMSLASHAVTCQSGCHLLKETCSEAKLGARKASPCYGCFNILIHIRDWGSCDWGKLGSDAWGRERIARARVVVKATWDVLYWL